jgi:glutathione S-transferase
MGKVLNKLGDTLSANNSEALILYGSAPSPCVRRVIITLLEKGLDFDWVEVDLPNMEQRSPAYLSLNPNGFVPTLCHRDQVIFESGVINEYLEEQFPVKPLMPSDPYLLAQVRMWIAAEGAMAKIFRPVMYQKLMAPVVHASRTEAEARKIALRSTNDESDLAWEKKIWNMQVLTPAELADKEQQLLSWLDKVEQALTGKQYLVGEQFSQADISLYPRVMMYSHIGLAPTNDRYPRVLRWAKSLETRASFEESLSEQAKKLQKMANSPMIQKLRAVLAKPKQQRHVFDSSFLWIVGKVIRKIQKVDELLAPNRLKRALPLPAKSGSAITAKHVSTGDNSGRVNENNQLELLTYPKSSSCKRVELLFEVLGLTYTKTLIDINANEHKNRAFLKLNPLGEVPVLKHGEKVITDSTTIAEYLIAEFSGEYKWQPTDSISRAKNRMWLALDAGTHKEIKPLWDQYIAKKDKPQLHITNEKNALKRIDDKLLILEKTLSLQPFLLGEYPQYADIAWHTQLSLLQRVPNFNAEHLPALIRWQQVMQVAIATSKECAA